VKASYLVSEMQEQFRDAPAIPIPTNAFACDKGAFAL
jgi:hypothetical protein